MISGDWAALRGGFFMGFPVRRKIISNTSIYEDIDLRTGGRCCGICDSQLGRCGKNIGMR